MSNNKILKGTAVLGIAGVIVKVLGALFKVPLTALIGTEGLAYYGYAYPLYSLFLVIATAGIPVAISRLVSERVAINDYIGAQRVFNTSRWLLLFIGVGSFVLCYFGAGFMAEHVYKDPGALAPIKAIAPALIFVPIMSSYRGYFQGRQNMNPTAISQFFEQIVRVAVGLVFAYILLDKGLDVAAAGATFGASMGAVGGLLIIMVIYQFNKKAINFHVAHSSKSGRHESSAAIVKKILLIAIPITIGASILPIINFADSAIVTRRLLDGGFTAAEARELWGQLSGYCYTMIGLPQVITQGISVAMVPAVAAAYKLNNQKELKDNISMGMRISMIIGMPCAMGMMALAAPILTFIFASEQESALSAAPTLQIMCLTVVLMSLVQTTNGILQGIDRQSLPVKNLAIGAVGKVVFTYILVAIPFLNIKGAAIGSVIVYLTAFVLNMKDLSRYTHVKLDYRLVFVKPIVSAVAMGACAFASYKLLFMLLHRNSIAMLVSIMVGVVVYAVLVLATKTITKEEIGMLPKGDKLVKILDKFI